MRKLIPLLLLLSLCAAAVPAAAQTRPRRVGQAGAPTASQPAHEPTTSSAPTRRQGGPPTLGGAPRANGGGATRTPADTGGPEEVDENEVVRVNTTLVTIPVSVMDRDGKYVPSIRREEFRIYEDGVEQQLAYFAAVEKPFTVALVLDNSTSTRFKTEEMQDAAIAFVDQLRPADRVLVVAFDQQVRVLAEPTSDRRLLRDAIRRTHNGGETSLYDAVDFVIHQRFNRIDGRKAIVLFTDGVDTSSRLASYESNVRDAEELDALIYPIEYDTYDNSNDNSNTGRNTPTDRDNVGTVIEIIGTIFGGGDRQRGGRRRGGGGGGGGSWPPGGSSGGGNTCTGCSREEYERGDRYLTDMARVTGGRLYRADTTRNLAQSFALIAEELRKQYSLGYYPKQQAAAGQRRRIRVRVLRPGLAVQARDSYVFNPAGPTQQQANTDASRTRPVLQGRHFGEF